MTETSRVHREDRGSDQFRTALASLRAAQKTSKGAPAYSRYVNRPLGRVFAAVAYVRGVRPNQVTFISACLTYAAIATIASVRPAWWVSLLVLVGLVVGYALDAADGQLARLRGGGSATGEWLDHTVDAVKIGVLHLAVAISWFRFQDQPDAWLLVPLGFQAVATVLFFSMLLMDHLRRAHRASGRASTDAARTSSPSYSVVIVLVDYGLLCWVLPLMVFHDLFRTIYLVLFAANLGFTFLALPRWYREVRTFDVPRAPDRAPTSG